MYNDFNSNHRFFDISYLTNWPTLILIAKFTNYKKIAWNYFTNDDNVVIKFVNKKKNRKKIIDKKIGKN